MTSITQITGANDSGEIAGFYVDAATGSQRGFIATPVPEPAAFVIASMLGGLTLAFGWWRKSRRS
jgi:hypothetical protein